MSHISYSEFKIWTECPHKHKLMYKDGLKGFLGNEYTAFGTAIHSTCEKTLQLKNNLNSGNHFQLEFFKELEKLIVKGVKTNKKLLEDMSKQGKTLAPLSYPALQEHFEEFEVISTEEQLYEPIDEVLDSKYSFKGFIDVVLQTSDGKYHIIDWKTCSWGWDAKKKNDALVTYQLTLYKHYFAKKHNIDPKNIETHFALLKRTAKKDNIEVFRVTSGKKKTENALNYLKKALHNIDNSVCPKNRLSCKNNFGTCEFYNTEHCT